MREMEQGSILHMVHNSKEWVHVQLMGVGVENMGRGKAKISFQNCQGTVINH